MMRFSTVATLAALPVAIGLAGAVADPAAAQDKAQVTLCMSLEPPVLDPTAIR